MPTATATKPRSFKPPAAEYHEGEVARRLNLLCAHPTKPPLRPLHGSLNQHGGATALIPFAVSRPVLLLGCAWACLILGACSGDPIKLESDMRGELAGTIKLDGPIQIQAQIQGPTIKYEGTYISDELLEEVQVSKTTGDWVLAVLGEPDAKSPLRDGTEIWRWTYRPVEQQVSIVELWGSTEKEPKLATRSVFIQLQDDVVVRKWKG